MVSDLLRVSLGVTAPAPPPPATLLTHTLSPPDCAFSPCKYRGDASNPTAAQFCLQPLRPTQLPGWIKRFWMTSLATYSDGRAPGSGGCNDGGDDNFGGAPVQHMTCSLVWGAGRLEWWCWEGLHTIASLPGSGAKLVASYTYPNGALVPPPGTERWHFNLWQARPGGSPQSNKRVHVVLPHFEWTRELLDFRGMGYPINTGIGGGNRRLAEGAAVGEEAPAASQPTQQHQPQSQPQRAAWLPALQPPPPAGSAGGPAPAAFTPPFASLLHVPPRDLSTEGDLLYESQVGVPPPLLAALMTALAAGTLTALAAGVLAYTRALAPLRKAVARRVAALPLVARTLAAVERGLTAVAAQELGAGGKPGGALASLQAALQPRGGGVLLLLPLPLPLPSPPPPPPPPSPPPASPAPAPAADDAAASSAVHVRDVAASRPRRRSSVGHVA